MFTPWHKSVMMVASLIKAVLFAVSVLSKGYRDNNEDRHMYTQLMEDYSAESGDKMEAERIMKMAYINPKNVTFPKQISVALLA